MIKPGDSQTKKTLHELAKEFPDKTYRELEKYRDADRQEEAEKIPLTESQKSQEELEPIAKGVCITAALKKDRTYPDLVEVMAIENDKLKKRTQEAEGELSILKGIETNRVKEAQAKSNQLQDELDRFKKENNDLYNKIADLTESLKSKDYFEKPDYKYLIEENRKLEQERNELQAENKKLKDYLEKRIDASRRSGM